MDFFTFDQFNSKKMNIQKTKENVSTDDDQLDTKLAYIQKIKESMNQVEIPEIEPEYIEEEPEVEPEMKIETPKVEAEIIPEEVEIVEAIDDVEYYNLFSDKEEDF